MILRHPKDKKNLCNVHKTKVVQLGMCLTCYNKATICETKGCIGYHEQNERAHNVVTLQYIRHIVTQYVNSNNQKRAYLKKMVHQFFTAARRQVQKLFTQVYESIDNFVFDDIIFHEDERLLIEKLIEEEYEEFTCEQVGSIIPKLARSIDFEDGHFTHLRNYLIAEKEKVQSVLNSVLLNLPEFRWKNPHDNAYNFYEINEQTLKEVNTKLSYLNSRHKRIRIKYIDVDINLLRMNMCLFNQNDQIHRQEFVKLLRSNGSLKDVQSLQLWDIDQNEFQMAIVQSILAWPHIRDITIFTSYVVTSTDNFQELIENRPQIQMKIFKKDWIF